MFKPAALFIGYRYTRAKRRNSFISFISLISILGIALGITVLITVLSVMNGFDREIHKRVFTIVAPMTISSVTGYVNQWPDLQKNLQEFPYVTGSAPFVTGEVLLNQSSSTQPALIMGIVPEQEKNVSAIAEKITQGSMNDLKPNSFGIVIGETLANQLGAQLGDKITVFTPQVSLTPAGVIPRVKRFTIVGIFKAGGGFGFDKGLGYMYLTDAQKLLGLGDMVSGLHVQIKNIYAAPNIATQLNEQLTGATITTWADQFGEFFHAVALEKTMMFFILMLIIAVAAFNLVSTLIMVVNEKQSDIAILRTFGATPGDIMAIFFVQGAIIGIFGTLLGILGGVLLAWNVTEIVNWIEEVTKIQFLSSNIYYVNYLPSHIEFIDVMKICLASLFLSFIATLYPAWRASKTDPVESLRYE